MFISQQETAVVILSYNGRSLHELFLPKIVEEASIGYDIFVVDHASTDDTYEYIQQYFPSVTLIRLQENHGFAWGYHEALKQISAKYYVLLSADFEVTKGWFAPLYNAMETYPDLAACQPKIRYYKDKTLFEYAGAAGGFMDKWGYMFCRGRMFSDLEKDEGQYDDDIETFWASGGCFFTRADLYHQLGGLDVDLFAHMEEIDLCWRYKNAGYKIGYISKSLVYHVGGSVISYGSPQKTFYNFRNNLVLLLKNEQISKLWWLLPWRLMLDGIAGIQFLSSGKFKNVSAIARAHFSFYKNFGKWYKKRKSNQQLICRPNLSGIYPKSLILSYYLKKKKKFSDLDMPVNQL